MNLSIVSLRVWAPLIAAAVGALFVYVTLGVEIPDNMMQQPFLTGVAPLLAQCGRYGALALLLAGIFRSGATYVHHLQWMNGEIPSCPRCGDVMEQRNGRFGTFWGCLRYPGCRGMRRL